MNRKPVRETSGLLLAQTCRRYRARVHASLEQIGLYRGQQFVLWALWEQEGLTHSELAERLCVQPATVTNSLKRMEKAGLVERRHDAEDARVSRVYLADAGRNIRTALEASWCELEERTFAGFSVEEMDELRRMLRRIQDNLARET